MIFVRTIQTPQFKPRTFRAQNRVNPTIWPALIKQVGHRREINQAQSAGIVLHAPAMRMAEKVRFDVAARTQNLHQLRGVLQRAGCGNNGLKRLGNPEHFGAGVQSAAARDAGEGRLVMDRDERRFVLVFIQTRASHSRWSGPRRPGV